MIYELWDVTISRNLGEYESEEAALRQVLALIDHFGDQHADNLVLVGEEDDDGLTGSALVQRSRELAAVRAD